VVRHSADILNNLSALRRDFELRVDKNVIAPLLRMVDDTRADIEKERRALKKAMSDMREARDQLERATTQLNQLTNLNGNGTIMTGMDGSFSSLDTGLNGWAQSDAISAANNRCTQAQSVLDEKERDLMASKDKLLSSLYSFIGQESNHVTLLVDFFRAQEAYLEESLQTVRRAIPELVAVIGECASFLFSIFAVDLFSSIRRRFGNLFLRTGLKIVLILPSMYLLSLSHFQN
ncbi:hypothetical protein FGIG_10021, partial [Fasciola gigantica]